MSVYVFLYSFFVVIYLLFVLLLHKIFPSLSYSYFIDNRILNIHIFHISCGDCSVFKWKQNADAAKILIDRLECIFSIRLWKYTYWYNVKSTMCFVFLSLAITSATCSKFNKISAVIFICIMKTPTIKPKTSDWNMKPDEYRYNIH